MRGRLLAVLAQLAVAAAVAPPALAEPAEIAAGCPVRELQLAGAGESTLVLWREGGAGGGKAERQAGCLGETRAAWLREGAAIPLDAGFLGAGFRSAASGARATALEGGRLLLVWAEAGAIHGALLGAGAAAPERRFLVTPADMPSDVAAPRPLAREDGGFLVVYESDFFSGRRRNPVWRGFSASGEPAGGPAGGPQPAFADFISVREPLAARLPGGAFAVGGPGIGPVGDGFFLQFWGEDGEALGEPVAAGVGGPAAGGKTGVLGGELAAAGEIYVFTWNMRQGKGQGEEKAFVRLYGQDGEPLAAARELGLAAATPALAAAGGKALLAFVGPGPERRLQLLELDPARAAAGELRPGPLAGGEVTALAIEPARRLLAWAEPGRIRVATWP